MALLAGCQGVQKEINLPASNRGDIGITNAQIKNSIELGGEWFIHNQSEEDFLHYKYLPYKDRYSTDNNDVRKMGALWSINTLYNFTSDERHRDLAEKGMQYFESFIEEENSEGVSYVTIDEKRKLAYPAFLIFSLIQMKEYSNRDEYLNAIARSILAHQREDGSYQTYLGSNKTGGEDYYPGEANLALMLLYKSTKDARYMEAVKKSFSYYQNHWKQNKTSAFVPWHTQALFILYQFDPKEEYRDFIFEMSDYMLLKQQTPYVYKEKRFIGGFNDSPGISTSSYLEGLIDAYRLAKSTGDRVRERKYANAIRLAVKFLLRLQFREDNMYKLEELNNLARGGFRQSRDSSNLRVDNNQHATMALIKIYREKLFD